MVRTRGKINLNYAKDLAVVRTGGQWIILAAVLIMLFILPYILKWTSNVNWLTFLNLTFITIIAVLGLNIITGMAGQVSMGHSAFMMVGAFVTAIFTVQLHFPFWAGLIIAGVIAALAGLIVGAPSLRLKGFYLAVATLAFFLIAQFIIKKLPITGGTNGLIGIPAPSIGEWKITSDTNWYYLILIITLIFIFFSVNLSRSRLGRAFFAVRDNDNTAASVGINAYSTKLRAFFIGSFFAGIAGGLMAGYITIVRLDQFDFWDSIWYLGMVFIGGGGSTAGVIMGVIFLRLIEQILHLISMASWAPPININSWVYITYAIFGLAIVLFISFQPNGLIAIWRKIRLNYKRWPFGY
jgi:branched-chain amino acid transport system permease protein